MTSFSLSFDPLMRTSTVVIIHGSRQLPEQKCPMRREVSTVSGMTRNHCFWLVPRVFLDPVLPFRKTLNPFLRHY
ncbi:hypothetical protein EUGRSUZ_C02151 [Eucalyptus grandis]|uniref:Uncharacterized protein n=2 Tax=Eucalyptus grandis TaxID=71139 RepID=A0ACC3LG00_EUCGR|nr:hypothetical protein EUGRSUZ_C02151 [Eucalyptus grandis]